MDYYFQQGLSSSGKLIGTYVHALGSLFFFEESKTVCVYLEQGTSGDMIEPRRKAARVSAHVTNCLNLNFLALNKKYSGNIH